MRHELQIPTFSHEVFTSRESELEINIPYFSHEIIIPEEQGGEEIESKNNHS